MKKLFILALLIAMAVPCYAATKATQASMDKGISGGVVGVGDLSSGDTAEVSDSGSVNTVARSKAITNQNGDGLAYTGACRIQTILVSGVSAGDSVVIYDALTATGNPKFDIFVGTAADTKVVVLGGAPFATGIYVDATDGDVITATVLDY